MSRDQLSFAGALGDRGLVLEISGELAVCFGVKGEGMEEVGVFVADFGKDGVFEAWDLRIFEEDDFGDLWEGVRCWTSDTYCVITYPRGLWDLP